MDALPMRPHHGLCLRHFVGEGYSDAFSANMARVKKALEANPKRLLRLQIRCDSICGRCPQRRENACVQENKVRRYDRRCLEAMGLQEGQILSWSEYSHRVEKLLQSHTLEQTCPGCQWLGLCRRVSAAAQLHGA